MKWVILLLVGAAIAWSAESRLLLWLGFVVAGTGAAGLLEPWLSSEDNIQNLTATDLTIGGSGDNGDGGGHH